jgi:DnaB-like helicase C terminal domain/Toprim-like/DNA primase catalytic core, N-terminal domain
VVAVQPVDVYLASKGIKVSRAAGSEVTVHCWWCPDGNPKGKGKLYLNRETWLYDCKRCGEHGGRRGLLDHFGDKDDTAYVPGADPGVKRRILTKAAALAHDMLLSNEKVMEYLLGRGLSPETIVEAQLGYVPKNVSLSRSIEGDFKATDLLAAGLITQGGQEFFNDSITIPYLSHGSVIQLREKKIEGKYRTTFEDEVRLYNADTIRDATHVFITEGEFDALMVQQAFRESTDPTLRATAVVGIPGAKAISADFDSWFEHATKVYVGLDPDQEGRDASIRIKSVLGTRARIVELPRDLPKADWSDWLVPKSDEHPRGGHTWRDVQSLMVEADLAGKRIYTVGEAANRWERSLEQTPGIKLGFPSIDSVIKPGLRPGQICIPLAKTGTGKTVWLSNVVHNTRQHRVLFISLEMTATEVYGMLRRIHHFWEPDARRIQMVEDYKYLRIVDENRLGEADLTTLVGEYAEDVGAKPDLIVIDYLGYYARGFKGSSPYEKNTDAVMALKAQAKQNEVVIIAPHQVNRGAKDGMPLEADDARDAGTIEETGDFVFGLYRPGTAVNDEHKVEDTASGAFNVGILKSRHGGKGRVANLRFSHMSLVVVDALDRRNVMRVEQENMAYLRGVDYEEYRRSHTNQQMHLVK